MKKAAQKKAKSKKKPAKASKPGRKDPRVAAAKKASVRRLDVPAPQLSPERALYVYGISDAATPPRITNVGVDGSSCVERIVAGNLACWISLVDRTEYGEELTSHMQNLDWLAGASLRHQRVVAELAAAMTVLPARFGTVFLSLDSLRNDLETRRTQLLESLDKIRGKQEWGVKVFARATNSAPTIEAASGRDYLSAKAAALTNRKPGEVDPEVEIFAAELQRIASDAAPAGKVSSGQRNLVWQASFLVGADANTRKRWDEALKKYATRWADSREIEITGPWPPYSFL